MRKSLLILLAFIFSIKANAQVLTAQSTTPGVRLTIGAAAKTYSGTYSINASNGPITSITYQIGVPFMGVTANLSSNTYSGSSGTYSYTASRIIDIGFPWGVSYVNKTFSRDYFTVSKGYFADRVELNWRVLNNESAITNFLVYRTDDLTAENPVWGDPIKTISKTDNSFTDLTAEGGKLYRYKLRAIGSASPIQVSDAESEYNTFITGVGYRNPTGIVSGNISFKGGNPVKDVLVTAVAEGGTSQFGNSLVVPSDGYVWVPNLKEGLKDSLTIQMWLNYGNAASSGNTNLFKLISNSGDEINANAQFENSGNTLTINIGSATYSITGYLPTGKLNNKGDDTFEKLIDNINKFIHLTFILKDNKAPELYLNGRPLSSDYINYMNGILGPNSVSLGTSSVSNISINTNANGNGIQWKSVKIGGGVASYYDDARIWSKALTNEEVRTTYKRYLRGDENSLKLYLRFNEAGGSNVYDMSYKGSVFNGNDGQLTRTSGSTSNWWSSVVPYSDQLGILGVTDANGNYSIAAIPYTGSGELFKITPSLGVHKFNPKQESLFIGSASSVSNRINFTDESSFVFKGRALYDTRGVFPATNEEVTGDIRDNESYNAYVVGSIKYPKGEYWAEYGTGDNANRIIKLKRYAPIPVVGGFVYVDNQVILDANNMPVQTNSLGRFNIQVPIGNHSISVKIANHDFSFNGRYPAIDSTSNGNGTYSYIYTTKEFFEDQDEEITFIDTTKVTVVGRVVGGEKELNKPIGFGFNGKYTVNLPSKPGEIAEKLEVSSVNNIGKAQITLGYRQPGVNTITPEYKTTFGTNTATGEYKIKLLPLRYELEQTGLTVINQPNLSVKNFLQASEIINFSDIYPSLYSYATYTSEKNKIDTLDKSLPYNYVKNFGYFATPQVTVLEQLAETTIKVGDSLYTIANNFAYPVYKQGKVYDIKFRREEQYMNYDIPATTPVNQQLTTVPATQGSLSITNSFAYPNSESIITDSADESKLIYTFTAGAVNGDVSGSYLQNLSARYVLNSTASNISGVKTSAIILGGERDGSQTFLTQGPDKIDFILRDPPGSGSYATIEKGSSFSLTTDNSYVFSSTSKLDFLVSAGAKFWTGIGYTVEADATNELGGRLNINFGTTDGEQLNTTYTFNQSISTSASNDITGAEADLYIGNSVNYFYGTYNNIAATETQKFDRNNRSLSIPISTTRGTKYITKDQGVFFSPTGIATTFVYSQNYVKNQLIPNYEEILNGIRNGTLTSTNNGVRDTSFYIGSINAWKEAIFRNEARKYLVYKDKSRDSLRNDIKSKLRETYSTGAQGASSLTSVGSHFMSVFDKTYYKNISLDSKVGSYGESIELANTTTYVSSFSLGLGLGVLLEQEATYAGSGIHIILENENVSTYNYNQQQDIGSTTNVSYTLADNDPYNLLSVDVINSFDGNGPIFIRRGGVSSCPAEPADSTYYFTPSLLSRYNKGAFDSLEYNELTGSQREEISAGTIFLEKPVITVKDNVIYGVPETGKAQFTLTLRNNSQLEPESVNFVLSVNPSTNPHGAKFSIPTQGVPITLNGSKAIQYTVFMEKGAPDVFDYNDIEISLSSSCDDNTSASVLVSAHFIQSCTKVEIARPAANWVVNATNAYSNGSTAPLAVLLNGYNISYSGFKKIVLQYRMQGSPNWTILKNYVANQTEKDALVSQGIEAASIAVINSAVELSYGFDIAGLGLADGNYEIRAVSYCSNGTIFETTPVPGKVDLNTPLLFGTPLPADGILSIGDDLKLRYSEPVKTNGTMTRVDFLVQKNQLPVAHEAALSFTGTSSKANIQMPYLKSGNLSIEFWLRNQSTSDSRLISQQNSFTISTSRNTMTFNVGGQSITGDITSDGLYHHYTTTYNASTGRFTIIEDDKVVKSTIVRANLLVDNNSQIDIGGSTFVGKIHELRLWNTELTRESSVANMNVSLVGNEDGLMGYWPMNEGNGNLAKDVARFKHITLDNVNWDIFPNTQSYVFDGTNYLSFTNASKSIFSSTMDGTIAFWMKSDKAGPATLLSNGKGDTTDPLTTSGYRNKWSFDLDASGALSLKAENNSYSFGGQNMTDGKWHHVAVVLKRKGNLSMYVDGVQAQNYPIQGLGGFSGSSVFVGGRGQISPSNVVTVDNLFNGHMDDIQIWNLAKQADQIAEDRFYEQDYNTTGLIFYAPLNQPEQANNNGPKYYIPLDFQTKVSDYAVLSSNSTLAYSTVTPPIKPIRNTERMVTNAIVNGDEMVINPQITDWASVEKKIAYITVANMYDLSDNRQESPITWTAYITKNPLKWFVDGYDNNMNLVLNEKKTGAYQLVIANVGGLVQNFTLTAPSWLKLQSRAGTIAPNSQVKINFTVDTTLSAGNYFDQIKLSSKYNFTEKIQLNLRVLKAEPNWDFNPLNFEENMNVISKVRIDGKLSTDTYDKVIAYYMDSVRGIAPIEYDKDLDEYYVLLTIYGNADAAGLPINFKIWDASDGRLKSALLNDSATIMFQPNLNMGNYSQPVLFTNSGNETQILSMNKGWTWLSFYLNDPNFSQLNTFFKTAKLTKGDVIKTSSPALFDVYNVSPIAGQTGWAGTISLNGGLSSTKMYKVKLEVPQKLMTTGLPVNLSTQTFVLDTIWTGLPYSANRNLPLNEALAYLDAQNGDIIKSQSQFAIYDKNARLWKGNLTSMYAGEGYMIKTAKKQTFSYPAYANTNAVSSLVGSTEVNATIKSNAITSQAYVSSFTFDGTNPSPSYLTDNVIEPVKLTTELSKYGETMNIVASIPKEFDKVVFYNTATNQVIGQSQDVMIDNNKYVFATIYGDSIVNIRAELVNKDTKVSATNAIVFVPNAVMGTIKSPYNIEYIKPNTTEVNAYPNPFVNDVTLEFNSTIQGTAYLSIYNEQTQLIDTKQINVTKGMNRYIYHANQANMGNYLIFKVDVGDQHFTKLIFKL